MTIHTGSFGALETNVYRHGALTVIPVLVMPREGFRVLLWTLNLRLNKRN